MSGAATVRRVFRANRPAFWMLAFVAGFYALIFAAGHFHVQKEAPVQEKAASDTLGELKKKEELLVQRLAEKPAISAAVGQAILVVFFLSLSINIWLLVKKILGSAWIGGGLPQKHVSWGGGEVFQVVVFFFFVEACVLILEGVLSVFVRLDEVDKNMFLMFNTLFRDVAAAALVARIVTRKFSQKMADLGLTTKDFLKNVWIGFVGYLAILPYLVLFLAFLALLSKAFSYEPPPQQVVQIYLKESSQKNLFFLTAFVAMLGPVIEEMFFRGFAYKAFRARYGVRRAAVFSALIFSALHLNWIAFLPIFFLGLFLAYLYEKTGSLVSSMTAHMIHNLGMVLLLMGFKSLTG